MEKHTGFGGISSLAWVVIGILAVGAATLIFWVIVVMLFGRSAG